MDTIIQITPSPKITNKAVSFILNENAVAVLQQAKIFETSPAINSS